MKVTITIELDSASELSEWAERLIVPSNGSQPKAVARSVEYEQPPNKRNSDVRGSLLGPQRHQCPECGLDFGTIKGLAIHRAKMHHDAIKAALAVSCPECGREFANKAGLGVHRARPHRPEPSKPFGCELCGRSFTSEIGRSIHHSSMHPDIPHPPKADNDVPEIIKANRG